VEQKGRGQACWPWIMVSGAYLAICGDGSEDRGGVRRPGDVSHCCIEVKGEHGMPGGKKTHTHKEHMKAS